MTQRKTPILLRPSPLTGEVMALYRYSRKMIRGREVLDSGLDGKQPVTADFDAIVLELLMDDAPDITAALDGAARGLELNDAERLEISNLRASLVKIIERHNATGHGAK
jgi:MoxR-like ATPase